MGYLQSIGNRLSENTLLLFLRKEQNSNFMNKKKPIKRHAALQSLSRDHHHGLLLSWKIRKGFTKGISIERMVDYASWFFKNSLLAHFELEEKYIFPLLGDKDELVKKALAQHRRLVRLFELKEDNQKNLCLIEEELECHIRFEERILFNKIQEVASKEELAFIETVHSGLVFEDNWDDKFWE